MTSEDAPPSWLAVLAFVLGAGASTWFEASHWRGAAILALILLGWCVLLVARMPPVESD